jgi:hypothetical protein
VIDFLGAKKLRFSDQEKAVIGAVFTHQFHTNDMLALVLYWFDWCAVQ